MNTEQLKSIENSLELIKQGIAGIETLIREATQPPYSSSSELPNNYSHLLPEGYEFCAEGEAEKVVKVLMMPSLPEHKQRPLGGVVEPNKDINMEFYRPIRKTPTASYQVDWSNAPEWADVHVFDSRGIGHWIGMTHLNKTWESLGRISGHNLPDGLDWKLSKTYRPC